MDKQLITNNSEVHYTVQGSGPALVLIHGYLESTEIWSGFLEKLCSSYTVVAVDIPGHGKSATLGQTHTMGAMAKVVHSIIEMEELEQVVLAGHSMGGYIVMEYAARFPDTLKGYILLHSTCFADNDEKRKNREREISLIRCGKKMQIVHTNIPKAFADDNIERMPKEVERLKQIAAQSPDVGIIALLRGMKDRKDHSDTLRNSSVPAMIVWGKRDNYIPESVFRSLKSINPDANVTILDESGHMGFLEQTEECVEAIDAFIGDLPQ